MFLCNRLNEKTNSGQNEVQMNSRDLSKYYRKKSFQSDLHNKILFRIMKVFSE